MTFGKRHKIIVALSLALVALIVTPILVLAALPDPDNDPAYFANPVNAYRNVLEIGDQLYLIYYNIDYAVIPSTPANEAWIIRHFNGADNTTNAAVVPYAYHDSGYGLGLASIYFSASDAPTWGSNYSMQITGNPSLAWASGNPPSTTVNRGSFSEFTGNTTAITKDSITNRIEVIAGELQQDWGIPTWQLLESVGGSNKFTAIGEAYFTNVINNLTSISPRLFSALSASPAFQERTYSYIYSDNLSGQLLGTSWDFTLLATRFGTERMWMSGLFWALAVIFIIYRSIRITKGYTHAFLLFYLFMPFGARIGYIPLVVPVFMMVAFGGLPVMWYFAHRQTGA